MPQISYSFYWHMNTTHSYPFHMKGPRAFIFFTLFYFWEPIENNPIKFKTLHSDAHCYVFINMDNLDT